MTKLTEKCREAIRQQYKAGASVVEIAAPFGISPNYVYHVVGPPRASKGKKPPTSNVIPIRDPEAAVGVAAMVNTAMGALGRAEDTRRASIMFRVELIIAADRVLLEIDTQLALTGADEMSVSQETTSAAMQDVRERARRELPAVIGLTEDELKLLHGVI
jgi:transposase-like protein